MGGEEGGQEVIFNKHKNLDSHSHYELKSRICVTNLGHGT